MILVLPACCICLFFCGSLAQYNKITMGPYDFIIRQLEECPEVGRGRIRFAIKLHRTGRDQFAVDANVTISSRIDDSYSTFFQASKFGNGGWNENFFSKDFPHICSSQPVTPKFNKKLAIAVGYPNGIKCPIEPTNYTIRNLKLDLDILHVIPMFVYGKYRGDLSFVKNSIVDGCLRSVSDIVPKRVMNDRKKKKG